MQRVICTRVQAVCFPQDVCVRGDGYLVVWASQRQVTCTFLHVPVSGALTGWKEPSPRVNSELSSPLLLACLQFPASLLLPCRAECPQPVPAGTHATWCLVRLGKDDAPRPGWDTKPPAASPTSRTERPHPVPFLSQGHREQAGTRHRQIQTHRCNQRRPQAVPQRDTDIGVHAGSGTLTYTLTQILHTQRKPWAVTTCTEAAEVEMLGSHPAGWLGKPTRYTCLCC